jgi:ubiquinone biosynthesis protein
MHDRVGLSGIRKKLTMEAGQWAQLLPEFPRLIHASLTKPDHSEAVLTELKALRRERQLSNRLMVAVIVLGAMALGVALFHLW